MGQLAYFPRGKSDTVTCGDLGKQRAEAFHSINQPGRKADLLAGPANRIVSSRELVFIEADEILVLQFGESDPFSQGQEMVVGQYNLKSDALKDNYFEFISQFRARVSGQGEVDSTLPQRP